jgi:N-carbamoyl-L-amino-acid hydrolase
MIDSMHRTIVDDDDIVRLTIGRLVVVPNAPSVIPGEATFSVDLRHPDTDTLERFGNMVRQICADLAPPCTVHVDSLVDAAPLQFSQEMQTLIRTVSERLRLPHMDLPSAAGHDSRNLNSICATGMIFVPCEKGISHNEAEAAKPGDLAAGARVLTAVLADMAERP